MLSLTVLSICLRMSDVIVTVLSICRRMSDAVLGTVLSVCL